MRSIHWFKRTIYALLLLLILQPLCVKAQTDEDAIMMAKNNFCAGATYSHNSWQNYWEGTFKRNNLNLGTVSTQMIALMGTYGVSSKLNLLFSVPYIQTNATAGTLHGQKGIQDLSLWLKWMPLEIDAGKGTFSLYTIGGLSTPLTNYIADFLPLSIGLHSTNLSARILADYQLNNFFVTASGTYEYRNNITIDRSSYYTTQLYLTSQVEMPDVSMFNFRTGYRSNRLIAEATFSNMVTLGGFDIRKNDMPFPSNTMNSTNVGVDFKYTLKHPSGLSIIGGYNYVVAGRNIGQSTTINGGVFYVFDFSHKTKSTNPSSKKK